MIQARAVIARPEGPRQSHPLRVRPCHPCASGNPGSSSPSEKGRPRLSSPFRKRGPRLSSPFEKGGPRGISSFCSAQRAPPAPSCSRNPPGFCHCEERQRRSNLLHYQSLRGSSGGARSDGPLTNAPLRWDTRTLRSASNPAPWPVGIRSTPARTRCIRTSATRAPPGTGSAPPRPRPPSAGCR